MMIAGIIRPQANLLLPLPGSYLLSLCATDSSTAGATSPHPQPAASEGSKSDFEEGVIVDSEATAIFDPPRTTRIGNALFDLGDLLFEFQPEDLPTHLLVDFSGTFPTYQGVKFGPSNS